MTLLNDIRQWARRIKRDVMTLWFAVRDPDTPRCAKLLGAVAVAYALSPIDLIPDFIPVLGVVDDIVLVPVLIWLAIRLLPADVTARSRLRAEAWLLERSARKESRLVSRWGAGLVIGVWIAIGAVLWWWWRRPN